MREDTSTTVTRLLHPSITDVSVNVVKSENPKHAQMQGNLVLHSMIVLKFDTGLS
jgi:hypothetical protein